MAAALLQRRTTEILDSYRAGCDEITGELDGSLLPEQFARFDGLARHTIRLLREAKTECVREEAGAAERILGHESTGQPLDLGYSAVKLEIDLAIDEVLSDKMRFRPADEEPDAPAPAPRERYVEDSRDSGRRLIDRLEQLAELHRSGVLTDDEFAVAKGAILVEDS